ncbi:hypothetical protein ACB098_11G040300 [Castanea mollissima]
MGVPHLFQSQRSPTSKRAAQNKASILIINGFVYFCGASLLLSLVWSLLSMLVPNLSLETVISKTRFTYSQGLNQCYDPPDTTFYDDPNLSYNMETPMKDWDRKRKEWLRHHPSFNAGAHRRILMLTGSQPSPCKNPVGDHLLLRLFKNKVDYCRLHGYDILYNNLLLHPKMNSYWAKYPVIKAAMMAHPEAEWIWWIDSDAVFTDMEFTVPLEKYKNHNLIVDGWEREIYEKKSWTGLNAGVFLIRNCQWSMDFMHVWTSMGPQSPDFYKWGQVQKSILKDKMFPGSDDQAALIYLILKQNEKWAEKIYLENEYSLSAYWLAIVDKLDNLTSTYMKMERRAHRLRRQHAEVVSECHGALTEQYLKDAGHNNSTWRRPFVTHFTGCQPCNGEHNPMYKGDACLKGMQKALNFADNQVLRRFGVVHPDLLNSFVTPLELHLPA